MKISSHKKSTSRQFVKLNRNKMYIKKIIELYGSIVIFSFSKIANSKISKCNITSNNLIKGINVSSALKG